MAHYQQLKFVELASRQFSTFFTDKKVIEIGSWDVNGSVRSYFNECEYVGVDIAEGNGVDLVCPGQYVKLPDNSFDVAISCECFEHNSCWAETFSNMCRMPKPGGLCLLTCATIGRREHGTTRTTPSDSLTTQFGESEYYRNLTMRDFKKRIKLDNIFSRYEFFYNMFAKDLYIVGIKHNESRSKQGGNERFANLRMQLKNITTERGESKAKALRVRVRWFLKRHLIQILGGQRLRDTKFFLSSVLPGRKNKSLA